jgi:tetratricopeptide (TPR) repeat protein
MCFGEVDREGNAEVMTALITKNKPVLLALFLSLVVLAVYLPTLRNDFVEWDDDGYVYQNLHIRSLDPGFFLWAFTDRASSNWHPVTWISHALDYKLWALNPGGHHFTSVVVHSLNTFILVLLIITLLEHAQGSRTAPSGQSITGSQFSHVLCERERLMTAGVSGLLFGLHPLHVESVAWVSERKDLLCAFFFLACISFYIRHIDDVNRKPVPPGTGRFLLGKNYLLALISFALALMSKPMAVSLPVVLLLLDWYPLERIQSLKPLRTAVIEKVPFFLASIAVSLAALATQKTAGAMELMQELTLRTRVFVGLKALTAYLGKMVAPVNLVPYYAYPRVINSFSLEYLLAAGAVTAATMYSIAASGRQKIYAAVWGYYLCTLLPVIGIVQVGGQYMADRYTYLPSIGPFLLVGVISAQAYTTCERLPRYANALKGAYVAAILCVVVLLSVMSVRQMGIWKNGVVFWSFIKQHDPEHAPLVYVNAGIAFSRAGEVERAIENYDEAIALNPAYEDAYVQRGAARYTQGYVDKALEDFEQALRIHPTAGVYVWRAGIRERQKLFAAALDDYASALRLDPGYSDAYLGRGLLLKNTGQRAQAIENFNLAIEGDPYSAAAFLNRGILLYELQQLDAAHADLDRAVVLGPDDATSRIFLGMVLKELGQYEQAIQSYTKALELNPRSVEAYNNRGVAYKHLGRLDQAMQDYSRAIELNPSYALAYCNRGILLGLLGRDDSARADYTKALELQPDLIKAYLDRGDLFQKAGDAVRAAGDYRKACRLGSEAGCEAIRSRR